MTSIEYEAFSECTNFTSIKIPNSVTRIGGGVFSGCTKLVSVNIPDNIEIIEAGVFNGCIRLKGITIPNSVTSIGPYAFKNCISITSIIIPNSVTSIGYEAFSGCDGLTSVIIPNNVTKIGQAAFYECSYLSSINIPYGITVIEDYTFASAALTSITIPDTVTSIGRYAFKSCNLTYVEIPSSVTSIGDGAFSFCRNLNEVRFLGNDPSYLSPVIFEFSKPGVKRYYFPGKTGFPAYYDEFSLSDVNNHWAKNQILNWVFSGYIKGYPDGTFKPDNSISRAEFITLVNNAFGFKEKATINYKDVSSEDWYTEAIRIAKEAGYITGYSDGTMKPNNPITRQEAAVIISRLQKLASNENATSAFGDAANIPAWSKGAIGAGVEAEILTGYPDNTFRPDNFILRAESVVALSKAKAYEE